MTVRVVTTMNRAGWKETGARMVESFRSMWPADVAFLLYAEGFDPDRDDVEVRALPAWVDDFKRRHADNRVAHGHTPTRYDFRFDAVKFAHKVGAMTDAGLRHDDGVLIWLDADTVTHAPVTHGWLEGLFPAPSYVAWLDRENSFPETGFIMFRCGHRSHRTAMNAYRDIYVSDQLFKLGPTADSFVFQYLIESMARSGDIEAPVSLSGERRWSHPFVNGPLGACLDHMKGSRKARGRSDPWDLRTPRSEPYWNQKRRA